MPQVRFGTAESTTTPTGSWRQGPPIEELVPPPPPAVRLCEEASADVDGLRSHVVQLVCVHVEDHARDAMLDFFYGVDMGVAGKTWSGLPGMPGLSFPVVDLLQDYDGEV
ncbi:hypothetical protein B296_00058924 [Ensete ventricosum]|uniref:Uncharacterized protein n=1 Tax=Ensete ventricosum TaxID=4639 RepID=A0A426XAH4_ENSVE|nr:hypothetical protein B296_00058924 [Ensete ventricosum]